MAKRLTVRQKSIVSHRFMPTSATITIELRVFGTTKDINTYLNTVREVALKSGVASACKASAQGLRIVMEDTVGNQVMVDRQRQW